jgi:phosphatidylglycerophosphate synthase
MVNKLEDQYDCPLDVGLYKIIETQLPAYKKLMFTPNILTTISILLGLLSAYEIFKGNFAAASVLWLVSYYFDCVDGKFARQYDMVTKFGDYYDHIGDALKYIVLIYALFFRIKKKLTNKQWMYIAIIMVLMLLSFIHLGYQEKFYDNKEESGYLNICKIFTKWDKNPKRTIKLTRHFGCGTFNLGIALVIFFWRK